MRHLQASDPPLTATLLLLCCARIVPARERWEWRQEWQSELWYVYRASAGLSPFAIWTTCTRFAFGAVNDALWLRRNGEAPCSFLQSARDCATWLLLLSGCAFLVATAIPGSREAMTSRNRAAARNAVSITRAGLISHNAPTIDFAEYEHWRRRGGRWFSDVAFYRVMNVDIAAGFGKPARREVAVATQSFARILGIEISSDAVGNASTHGREILLLPPTERRRQLASEARVGDVVRVAGHEAVIGGLSQDLRSVVSNVDALLLVSDSELAHIAPESLGFAVATLTEAAEALAKGGRWSFSTLENGQELGFVCVRVAERRPRPIFTIVFALFLACLALPATTPLPLGEYPAAQHPRFGEVRWRRWIFLSVKLVCVTLIVAFVSLVIGFGSRAMAVENSTSVQLFCTFTGLLFSFRWALRDQRLRCPVCLSLLTNPARVGHPSRSFLAWHGTEFMCDKGHGLLHVPDMATSWFSTQRWLSLDVSWRALFPNVADQ